VSQAVYVARVMKLNAWEWQSQERIQAICKEEISAIQNANSLKVWNETLFFSSNIVITIVIFLVHISLENTLTPRTVFATLSLLQTLQIEMTKHVSLGVMGVSFLLVGFYAFVCCTIQLGCLKVAATRAMRTFSSQ